MSVTIASYGGGKNSKYAIAEWVTRGNPLHLVMFADTGNMNVRNKGAEKPTTYSDVQTFQEWLISRGVPCIVVRVSGETLEENCLRRHALPAIAYGFKTCSQRWKLEPQEKFCNNWEVTKEAWARGEKVTRLVGYHAGEPQRAIAIDDPKYVNRYPLIEWGVDNEGCAEGIKRLGLCVPPKSSCFFCPNMDETEILDLADDHPDLIERALCMEANADLTQIKGLSRDISWKQILDYDRAQLALLPKRDRTMPCGCYDGE